MDPSGFGSRRDHGHSIGVQLRKMAFHDPGVATDAFSEAIFWRLSEW